MLPLTELFSIYPPAFRTCCSIALIAESKSVPSAMMRPLRISLLSSYMELSCCVAVVLLSVEEMPASTDIMASCTPPSSMYELLASAAIDMEAELSPEPLLLPPQAVSEKTISMVKRNKNNLFFTEKSPYNDILKGLIFGDLLVQTKSE